jgi:ADP-ribose pyrophosphatase
VTKPGEPGRIATRRVHTGRIITLDIDTVRFPDGSSGELEMIRHPGASAIVPVLGSLDGGDPDILLIRQYRYAADGYLYEIPAGRLDPGESPADCAARELVEETGYTAATIQPLTTILTTPGFTDERIHLFVASELTVGEARPEADEFMTVEIHRLSQAVELIRRGELTDGKSALALLYVWELVVNRAQR